MDIEFNVLDRLFFRHQTEYENAALRVLRSGWYVLGRETDEFENEFASCTGAKYCVGLNSGLDALILALRALGIGEGDEVIVPANTYIATVLAITENRATPVFVEPDEYYNLNPGKIEAAITDKTKAVIVVHLFGQAADIGSILHITKRNGLYLIEDCAQAHTVRINGQMAGTFGDIGCFSFFPTKNFGAFGDAGAVITNNETVAHTVKKLRNYGGTVKYVHEIKGINSRLDELQAALLRTRMLFLSEIVEERVRLAQRYIKGIKNPKIRLPKTRPGADHVWHLFVAATPDRDLFQQYLLDNRIKTQVHYPIPPHLSPCYTYLGYKEGDFPITEEFAKTIISLPLYNGMTEKEIQCVIDVVNMY